MRKESDEVVRGMKKMKKIENTKEMSKAQTNTGRKEGRYRIIMVNCNLPWLIDLVPYHIGSLFGSMTVYTCFLLCMSV